MNPELPQLNWFEPNAIVAGDTASWFLQLGNYPPPTWVLSYALRGKEEGQYINFSEVTPSPDGVQHLIQILPAVTSSWLPGLYRFQSYVTNISTTDRVTIGWGNIQIVGNLEAEDPVDGRSYYQKTLDILEAAMQGRLPQGMEHYTIAGRAISKIPIKELNMIWREYKVYVQQEQQAQQARKGLGNPRQVLARFDKPGTTSPIFPYGPNY